MKYYHCFYSIFAYEVFYICCTKCIYSISLLFYFYSELQFHILSYTPMLDQLNVQTKLKLIKVKIFLKLSGNS